jgi:hypothetical protein
MRVKIIRNLVTQSTEQEITVKSTTKMVVNEMDKSLIENDRFKKVIEAHDGLIKTLLTEYNDKFDYNKTSRFSEAEREEQQFFSEYVTEHSFKPDESHFTDDFSQRVGTNMIVDEILDTFTNQGNRLDTHKTFMSMVLTPLFSQKDYDVKV